ncbi:MAG: hypothetical protein Q9224_005797, partial [Gallowayella concinna]
MVSLLNRVHRLAPYFLVKQTLKIGNAASMLNGMTQLVLAKMNISTLTSWFSGQASDSGMNLLQQYGAQRDQEGFPLLTLSRIIAQVLNAEVTELRKRAKEIEQSKEPPDKSQMDRLRKYVSEPAEEQQKIRTES